MDWRLWLKERHSELENLPDQEFEVIYQRYLQGFDDGLSLEELDYAVEYVLTLPAEASEPVAPPPTAQETMEWLATEDAQNLIAQVAANAAAPSVEPEADYAPGLGTDVVGNVIDNPDLLLEIVDAEGGIDAIVDLVDAAVEDGADPAIFLPVVTQIPEVADHYVGDFLGEGVTVDDVVTAAEGVETGVSGTDWADNMFDNFVEAGGTLDEDSGMAVLPDTVVDAAPPVVPTNNYGLWIGGTPDEIYTADFIDIDGDGIDDRWQAGAGLPDWRITDPAWIEASAVSDAVVDGGDILGEDAVPIGLEEGWIDESFDPSDPYMITPEQRLGMALTNIERQSGYAGLTYEDTMEYIADQYGSEIPRMEAQYASRGVIDSGIRDTGIGDYTVEYGPSGKQETGALSALDQALANISGAELGAYGAYSGEQFVDAMDRATEAARAAVAPRLREAMMA